MKLVSAIIRPYKLDALRETLTSTGIQGMTVMEAQGVGCHKDQVQVYRGLECAVNFVPKVKVEIVVRDDQVEQVTEALRLFSRVDANGTERIFVTDVGRAVRIRTGENDSDAI